MGGTTKDGQAMWFVKAIAGQGVYLYLPIDGPMGNAILRHACDTLIYYTSLGSIVYL